jgi:hypothetical protein
MTEEAERLREEEIKEDEMWEHLSETLAADPDRTDACDDSFRDDEFGGEYWEPEERAQDRKLRSPVARLRNGIFLTVWGLYEKIVQDVANLFRHQKEIKLKLRDVHSGRGFADKAELYFDEVLRIPFRVFPDPARRARIARYCQLRNALIHGAGALGDEKWKTEREELGLYRIPGNVLYQLGIGEKEPDMFVLTRDGLRTATKELLGHAEDLLTRAEEYFNGTQNCDVPS